MIARKSQSAVRNPSARTPMEVPSSHASSSASTTTDISPSPSVTPAPDWWSDRYSVFLLIALYAAQGLPMGLAFGSIPFLLKERGSSYGALAKFSFASLPYSLKLFIAPVVDSFYSRTFGRRKSWIVPVQLAIGLMALLLSARIHTWVNEGNVNALMPTFLLLIAMTATQDIAVDGWSLTMLQKANVCYASTCQSLGLSIGFFATFTIFLALSNDSFCDNYMRPLLFFSSAKGPLVDLTSILRLLGLYYLCLTVYITFWKNEVFDSNQAKKYDVEESDPSTNDENNLKEVPLVPLQPSRSYIFNSIKSTYSDLFIAVRLSAVKSFALCLLLAKLGFSAYDNVLPLKLLELGFSKEKMASMAVLQAPFSLLGTLLTGRWVAKKSPIKVYLVGWTVRFALHLLGPPCVALLKHMGGVVTPGFYLLVLTMSITYSLAAECLMFVGIGAFFLNVTSTSVHVAGSYLTLLNTASNMGGTWHKAVVLWLVDRLTVRQVCEIPAGAAPGTECPVLYDGYYVISIVLMPVGMAVGVHLFRTLPQLGRLPDSAWKASR